MSVRTRYCRIRRGICDATRESGLLDLERGRVHDTHDPDLISLEEHLPDTHAACVRMCAELRTGGEQRVVCAIVRDMSTAQGRQITQTTYETSITFRSQTQPQIDQTQQA